MIYPSLAAGLAQLQALATYIDQGSSNATFVFYSDTKPASVGVAASASAALATLTLPKPCFKQLNADSIELSQTDAALVTKAGTAVWARLYNGAGLAVADFVVGSDISLANPTLVLGATLMMNSIVLKPITV